MTRGRIDLHVHTTASDGTRSPAAVVAEALAAGVGLLAICDHDTTDGVREAERAAQEVGLVLIAGVEMSVGAGDREIHVLGYFVSPDEPGLRATLATLRRERDRRNAAIVERLGQLGAPVTMERIRAFSGGGAVGRPHIAKALVEAGHVGSQGEAFGRYLARGKAGYVGRGRLSPVEAAVVIRRAGGIPVLAHPVKLGGRAAIEAILDEGMEGLEVYHCDHTAGEVEALLAIAQARELLVTGGSDSHGPDSDRPIAVGSVDVPDWVAEQVLARRPAGRGPR